MATNGGGTGLLKFETQRIPVGTGDSNKEILWMTYSRV
jgi:hypothetical protein